jgi:hypothetical protein
VAVVVATQAPPRDGEGSAIDLARQLETAHAERDALRTAASDALTALDMLEAVTRKVGGFMSYEDQAVMSHALSILEHHGKRERKSFVWKDRP